MGANVCLRVLVEEKGVRLFSLLFCNLVQNSRAAIFKLDFPLSCTSSEQSKDGDNLVSGITLPSLC